MKKILEILLFFLLSISPAFADTMLVQALNDISTTNPNEIVRVQVLRDCTLDGILLREGYRLTGKMIVTDAKRLKRNATFTFYPIQYVDLENNITRFNKLYYGKYSPKLDIDVKELTTSAAVGVVNHFINGISIPFYALKGAIQNKNGNVIKSAGECVYEHSILSFASKGNPTVIIKETVFGLKFDECENKEIEDTEENE